MIQLRQKRLEMMHSNNTWQAC